jgi:hypothetical protein
MLHRPRNAPPRRRTSATPTTHRGAQSTFGIPMVEGRWGRSVDGYTENRVSGKQVYPNKIQMGTRCPAWPLEGASRRATAQPNGAMWF